MEKKCEENKSETTMNVAGRLPELDEVDANNAVSHQQLSWAHGFMDNHKDGQMHFIKDCGVHLQKVTEEAVRCIAVVDHPYCFSTLAMVTLAFERAGIELQVDPYTVVIPYEPREEGDTEEAAGVEVA
ncbi:uncharacterized protein METZ01_LOCUS293093 [marine metagenome]|uniref:Uncharacterized protein n=1 Tax=marine metagenome TaxID=408172 RepID=A0A382LU43_9ZZZZ|tara:strand:- start:364 stop:747 length:384 start_codon:yes stop_codon:yes gene_type:complete